MNDAARGPRGRELYAALRERLLNGEIKPGQRLLEAELAAEYGISRTPVREALRELEMQGLLQHEPHRGMVVTRLDAQAVGELYAMREALEGTAAGLAARHASEVEIELLGEMVHEDQGRLGRPEPLAAANRRFHEALYRAAHNRYLLRTLNALAESIALLGTTSLAVDGRDREALDQHAALIDAIRVRDGASAERLAREHVRASYRARLLLLNGLGDA